MKFIIGCFILFFSMTAQAEEPETLSQRVQYFYKKPDIETVIKLIKEINHEEILAAAPNTWIGILPQLALLHPNAPHIIFKDKYSTQTLKDLTYIGLKHFDAEYLIPDDFTPELEQTEVVSLLHNDVFTPDELDILWGAFMITGNIRYIDAIIKATEDKNHILTKEAARYSLHVNLGKHEAVLERLKQHLDRQNPNYRNVKEIYDKFMAEHGDKKVDPT